MLGTFQSVRRVRGLDHRPVGFGDFNGLMCSMTPEGGRFLVVTVYSPSEVRNFCSKFRFA